jgi:Mn2+/Fe2+ NRAMP family transporter
MKFQSFRNTFSKLLPGIFIMGYNIGTGSITAMSKAGANFGTALLWTLLISCVITYYLIILFSKYTMFTGETSIEAFKKHIHPGISIFIISGFALIIAGASMGLMGIIADVLYAWTKYSLNKPIKPLVWATAFSILIYILLWFGNTEKFKNILAVLVFIMGICFLANLLFAFPSLKSLLSGFIPKIPQDVAKSDNSAFLIIASMIGTTVSSVTLMLRSSIVKDSSWTMEQAKTQKNDALFSVILMFVISMVVMIAAAATLYVNNLSLNHPAEMVTLLQPIAKDFSIHIMVFGIVAAGLSSHIPNILAVPWLICHYTSRELNVKRTNMRLILLIMTSFGVFIPLFNAKPVFIMLISQGLLAVMLPLIISSQLYLINRKPVRGKCFSRKDNILMTLILLFAIYMGMLGIIGIIKDIR